MADMPDAVSYHGFRIFAKPLNLKSGEWTTQVHIMRGDTIKPFSASNTFKTRQEAVAHCIEFGRRIIDGEIPDFSGADLP